VSNERTNTTTGDRDGPSNESAELRQFGERLRAFGSDIVSVAGALDGLAPDTRRRVLDEIAARCGTFGDLAHDARRAVAALNTEETDV
jgi:hypothetical protein